MKLDELATSEVLEGEVVFEPEEDAEENLAEVEGDLFIALDLVSTTIAKLEEIIHWDKEANQFHEDYRRDLINHLGDCIVFAQQFTWVNGTNAAEGTKADDEKKSKQEEIPF